MKVRRDCLRKIFEYLPMTWFTFGFHISFLIKPKFSFYLSRSRKIFTRISTSDDNVSLVLSLRFIFPLSNSSWSSIYKQNKRRRISIAINFIYHFVRRNKCAQTHQIENIHLWLIVRDIWSFVYIYTRVKNSTCIRLGNLSIKKPIYRLGFYDNHQSKYKMYSLPTCSRGIYDRESSWGAFCVQTAVFDGWDVIQKGYYVRLEREWERISRGFCFVVNEKKHMEMFD